MKTRISVVIPTYKSERFLAEAIQSVLAQTSEKFDLECIVVDDGSPQRDAEVAQGFGSALTLIRQKNAGVNAARHAGMLASSGEWLCFLDADDVLLPGALERRWQEAVKDERYVLVQGPAQHVDQDGRPITVEWHWPVGDAARGDVLALLLRLGFIVPSAAMIKRATYLAVGGFDISYPLQASEDYLLFLNLAAEGHFGYVDEPTYLKRVHPGAASAISLPMEEGEFESRWHFFKKRSDVRQRLGLASVHRLLCAQGLITGARLEKRGLPLKALGIYGRLLMSMPAATGLYRPAARALLALLRLRSDVERAGVR